MEATVKSPLEVASTSEIKYFISNADFGKVFLHKLYLITNSTYSYFNCEILH